MKIELVSDDPILQRFYEKQFLDNMTKELDGVLRGKGHLGVLMHVWRTRMLLEAATQQFYCYTTDTEGKRSITLDSDGEPLLMVPTIKISAY